NAGIVDQHVDPSAELVQRRVPGIARRGWVRQVAGDQLVAAAAGVAADVVAGGLEQGVSRGADAAARSSDEDVHGCRSVIASAAKQSSLDCRVAALLAMTLGGHAVDERLGRRLEVGNLLGKMAEAL